MAKVVRNAGGAPGTLVEGNGTLVMGLNDISKESVTDSTGNTGTSIKTVKRKEGRSVPQISEDSMK